MKRKAAARQAAAEAAEACVSLEEREELDMAARAVEVAEVATENVKVAKNTEEVIDDTGKVDKDEANPLKGEPSVKEVMDEMCPDSQYGSETKTENTKSKLKPPEELPPPKRDRTLLGKVDYCSTPFMMMKTISFLPV